MFYVIKNISIFIVCKLFVLKFFYQINYLAHMLGGFRINISFFNFKFCYIIKKSIDIIISYFAWFSFFFVSFFNNLIVNISKIHNKFYFVSFVLKISSHHISHNKRARITDMKVIINSWSAHINFNFVRINWNKFFYFFCECVVKF